jgi:tetratricopeptide (TPR) repeat protein
VSSEAIYERYKTALKQGHVATLHGRLDEALAAYAEAASIAPERATPHTSAGTALLRAGRAADALGRYAAALALAPRDEAALLGRARALDALGHRRAAAEAFDVVADVYALADRAADAVDAARRALELAEGRERRRTLQRLIGRLRASELDGPARDALDKALQILADVTVARGGAFSPAAREALDAEPAGEAEASAPTAISAESELAEPPVTPEPAAPGIRAALDRDLAADIDVEAIARAVDDAIDGHRVDEAREGILDAAATYRRAGDIDAALDACYRGLSLAPDDVDLHLALVELYEDQGWSELATEKLDLLERLGAIDGNDQALARVAVARVGAA